MKPSSSTLRGHADSAAGNETHPTSPVAPGDVVAGKYRVDRMVGFGGMGVVCEGTHLELGTKVAIKFVRLEHANDERAVARFLSEARSAAQLRSQHTCRVMDCGRLETGGPYLVMEYLDGADLRRIVSAQGRMPVEEAVSFALQACEALAEAHSRGIVHRDIKPENLFLSHGPDGSALIKVLDFGISKQLGRVQGSRALTERTDSVGSPHHMSPEQMIDPTTVDARSDIWALGVLLYELLTGDLPFKGDSVPQVCANVMTAHPPSPRLACPDIPEALAAVVLRCMEKDREARFPDVGALGRALEDFGGSTSAVMAARVERILERALATPAVAPATIAESRFGPAGAHDDADHVDGESSPIPGVPRRSPGVAIGALAALVAGLASAAYLWRAADNDEASAAPSAPQTSSSGLPAVQPMASAEHPAPSSSAGPRPRTRPGSKKKTAARRTEQSATGASAPEEASPPPRDESPLPSSTSVYPELKPPELPAMP